MEKLELVNLAWEYQSELEWNLSTKGSVGLARTFKNDTEDSQFFISSR